MCYRWFKSLSLLNGLIAQRCVCGALVAAALPHIFSVISSKVHLPRIEFLHGQNPSTFQVIGLSLLSMRRKCCQKIIKKRQLSHFFRWLMRECVCVFVHHSSVSKMGKSFSIMLIKAHQTVAHTALLSGS